MALGSEITNTIQSVINSVPIVPSIVGSYWTANFFVLGAGAIAAAFAYMGEYVQIAQGIAAACAVLLVVMNVFKN